VMIWQQNGTCNHIVTGRIPKRDGRVAGQDDAHLWVRRDPWRGQEGHSKQVGVLRRVAKAKGNGAIKARGFVRIEEHVVVELVITTHVAIETDLYSIEDVAIHVIARQVIVSVHRGPERASSNRIAGWFSVGGNVGKQIVSNHNATY